MRGGVHTGLRYVMGHGRDIVMVGKCLDPSKGSAGESASVSGYNNDIVFYRENLGTERAGY